MTLATHGWRESDLDAKELDYIQSRSLSPYNNINKFDFSTIYTTIPPTESYRT